VSADAPSTAGEMTLIEHLAELRDRLFRSALALVVGALVGYALFDHVLGFLISPYCQLDSAFRNAAGDCALVATRPLEPFSFRIKTSLVIGLFLGGLVIFTQLWRFITPGLTSTERRYALPFVVLSQVMFVAGGAFAFFVIPQGLAVLLNIAGPQVAPFLAAADYTSFLLTMIVAFGLTFEVPLVLVFLSLLGVVTAPTLRRARPYAIVGSSILAALVTPTTDPVTMLLLMAPLTVFYELSIWAAWWIGRRRAKREAATA
jgi:sec-independent protein translocase protein TatC